DTAGVLFTYDTHLPEVYAQSEEAKQFPPHCEKYTKGWELVVSTNLKDALIPVYTLQKSVFAMWEEDGIALRRLNDPI
ncbi:hypothetical protein, partial [Escherichia coli]|uniref:hypothetical protein n=1 Tax=Escherichia coli TaxID=562 RepID=UPI001963AAB6